MNRQNMMKQLLYFSCILVMIKFGQMQCRATLVDYRYGVTGTSLRFELLRCSCEHPESYCELMMNSFTGALNG